MARQGTVVITGASTGIGRASALRLARGGFDVLAGVRREEDGAALRAEDGRIEPIIVDVTDAGQVAALAARVGGAPLAGLVNNAGIAVAGPLEGIPLDDVRRQYEVNVFGLLAVTQALLPAIRAGHGRIVNIGSIGGRIDTPSSGPTAPPRRPCAASAPRCGASCARGTSASRSSSPARWTPRSGARARRVPARRSPRCPSTCARSTRGRWTALVAATRKVAAGAGSPDDAALAIEHALTAERPRTLYTVGRRAHIQGALHSLLPAPAFDALVARAMKS